MNSPRKAAFVLVSTDHGSMIVNRFDQMQVDEEGHAIGVGLQLLERSQYEAHEIETIGQLLVQRMQHHGEGAIAIDCGANIGANTIDWARLMSAWGFIIAIEAQERLYYALAGNIALNNCFNARCINAAVSDIDGTMQMPKPDYFKPSNFGGLELRPRDGIPGIGQGLEMYNPARMVTVQTMTLDSLELPRCDLIKIDVEGMEVEVLRGARKLIEYYSPIIIAEHIITGEERLRAELEAHGYEIFHMGMNLLAVHQNDPTIANIKREPAPVAAE